MRQRTPQTTVVTVEAPMSVEQFLLYLMGHPATGALGRRLAVAVRTST